MLALLRGNLRWKRTAYRRISSYNPLTMRKELDVLYAHFYRAVHDMNCALDLSASQAKDAFANQWKRLKDGKYMLSDAKFKENVVRILCEEEIQIRADWFPGKTVLDAGCGNGRWSYGFAQMGAKITEVDVNAVAVSETRKALSGFGTSKEFYVSPMEKLLKTLPSRQFDLVFCWGGGCIIA